MAEEERRRRRRILFHAVIIMKSFHSVCDDGGFLSSSYVKPLDGFDANIITHTHTHTRWLHLFIYFFYLCLNLDGNVSKHASNPQNYGY